MSLPMLSLSEIASGGLFVDGDWVETKDQDPTGEVRLTQLADVGIAQFRDRSDRWMRDDQAARLNCTFLRPQDVLIARMPDPIGRACLVPDGIGRAVTVVDVAVLRVAREDVIPSYVMWMINSPMFHGHVTGLQSGTTRKRISRKNLARLEIPVPPLNEQRRIVEILEDHLSRLDATNDYLAAARHRTGSMRKAALERWFSKAQQRVPLDQLVDHIEAGKSFGSAHRPAEQGEWGIVKVSAMTWGEFRPEENKAVAADKVDPRYEIREGDLLVSRANTSEYVGASVRVPPVRKRLLLSDKSLRVVPRPGVNAEWLCRALQSPSARRQISALATGTKDSMRNISQKSLLRVELPLVTEEDQRTAVAVYRDIDERARGLSGAVDLAERRTSALRRAILAAAFSGRLTGHRTDDEVIEELAQ